MCVSQFVSTVEFAYQPDDYRAAAFDPTSVRLLFVAKPNAIVSLPLNGGAARSVPLQCTRVIWLGFHAKSATLLGLRRTEDSFTAPLQLVSIEAASGACARVLDVANSTASLTAVALQQEYPGTLAVLLSNGVHRIETQATTVTQSFAPLDNRYSSIYWAFLAYQN